MNEFFKYHSYHNVEQLKKEWRTIALQNHPDKGGNAEVFKKALAEYERLLSMIGAGFTAESDSPTSYGTWQEFLANISPVVRDWIATNGAKIVSLGASLEITGTWVWIGNTSPKIAPELKAMGLKWASAKKLWFMNGEPWRGQRMNMESIRGAFGSNKFGIKQEESLSIG